MTTRKKTKRKAAKKKATRKEAAREPAVEEDEPVELTRKAEWSISQFWLNTGFARETVRKRFADARLKPSRMVKGYPVFLVSDALPVLFYTQDGEVDPDKMKPFERRAYYQGELDKLKLQVERGEVVPAFEVEALVGRILKIFARSRDTMPDRLERDVGMSARALALVEKVLDEEREAIAAEIVGDDDADSAVPAGA